MEDKTMNLDYSYEEVDFKTPIASTWDGGHLA